MRFIVQIHLKAGNKGAFVCNLDCRGRGYDDKGWWVDVEGQVEKPGTSNFMSSLEVQILPIIPLIWVVASPKADSLSSKSCSFYNSSLFTNLGKFIYWSWAKTKMIPDQLSFAWGSYPEHSKRSDIGIQLPLLFIHQQLASHLSWGRFLPIEFTLAHWISAARDSCRTNYGPTEVSFIILLPRM